MWCPLLFVISIGLSASGARAFDVEGIGSPNRPQSTAMPNPALHALLDAAALPRLRWPRLSDVRPDLQRLYRNQGDVWLWSSSGEPTQQAAAVIEQLRNAAAKGLRAADFEVPVLDDLSARLSRANSSASLADVALFDVTLSLSLIRYLRSLHGGRVSPYRSGTGISPIPTPFDSVTLVQRLAQGAAVETTITEVEPASRSYRDLLRALARFRSLMADAVEPTAPSGVLRPGMRQPAVANLRRLLRTFGDLPADASEPAEAEFYDPLLVEAVKRFQRRHGLAIDGIVGKATADQLAVPMDKRIEQIELSLERFRWLPGSMSGPGLIVNIPSFELYGSRSGMAIDDPDFVMKVIVGKPKKGFQTPEFNALMKTVVFRPYWNVPPSITRREIVPILRRNPGYLAKQGMEIVDGFGSNPRRYSVSGATLARLQAGTLKVRQKPGSRNALGRVKFLFPNPYSVYMHDTPARRLFQRSKRAFSHGCIRVHEPLRLARFVLHDQPGWSDTRIEQAMKSSRSRHVALHRPVPVYVFYSTVLVDPDGTARFFDDIYGRDRQLERRLAKGFPYRL